MRGSVLLDSHALVDALASWPVATRFSDIPFPFTYAGSKRSVPRGGVGVG